MKYPAILRNILGNQTVLAVNAKLFIHMGGEFELEDTESYSFDSHYTNITHEYLSNTWGVVESKEHAEFIIELAGLHGFDVGIEPNKAMCFEFSVDSVSFYGIPSEVFAHNEESREITIPLPPKAKEWPQFGDEVVWGSEVCNGVVKAIDEHLAWIKTDQGSHVTEYIDKLKKPKSKQEILIKELQTKLCNNNAVDNYILACDIINGEIEGLNYESK